MSVLAIPEESQLLLINPVFTFHDQPYRAVASEISEQFNILTTVADYTNVPRYFALSKSQEEKYQWLSRPCEDHRKRVYEFPIDATPWSNTSLVEAMRLENRQRVFVCGFWLDTTVTTAALSAYVDGFDVHLIVDLSPGRIAGNEEIALARLFQIGVLPISTRQLIYEWMTSATDKNICKKLNKLIELVL